jgi:hypothetical protein
MPGRRHRLADQGRRSWHDPVMRTAQTGDVIYCDPPYCDRDDAKTFIAYGANGFGFERQRELATLARELVKKACPSSFRITIAWLRASYMRALNFIPSPPTVRSARPVKVGEGWAKC